MMHEPIHAAENKLLVDRVSAAELKHSDPFELTVTDAQYENLAVYSCLLAPATLKSAKTIFS